MLVEIITDRKSTLTISTEPECDAFTGELDPCLDGSALDAIWNVGASVDAVCELLDLAFGVVCGDEIQRDGFTYRLV